MAREEHAAHAPGTDDAPDLVLAQKHLAGLDPDVGGIGRRLVGSDCLGRLASRRDLVGVQGFVVKVVGHTLESGGGRVRRA